MPGRQGVAPKIRLATLLTAPVKGSAWADMMAGEDISGVCGFRHLARSSTAADHISDGLMRHLQCEKVSGSDATYYTIAGVRSVQLNRANPAII